MSTSVYNPLGLRFAPSSSSSSSRTPDKLGQQAPRRGPQVPAAVRKVSRVLFGPVDRAETHRFIEEELSKIRVSQSELWNFDFRREAQLDPEGAYEWRPATPPPRRPVRRRAEPQRLAAQDALYHLEHQQPTEEARPRGGGKSPRPQRLITDYLKKKKSSSDYVKKDWPSAVERPAKLPRLSEMS